MSILPFPIRRSADLRVLATRALDATANQRPDAEIARHDFIEQLSQQTGLSENLLYLLRKSGLLP